MRVFALTFCCLLSLCVVFAQSDSSIRQEIEALKQQIEQLNQKVQELETRLVEQESAAPPVAPATNLPQISVVANGAALFTSRSGIRERNRFEQDEMELAFQSYVYPSIRFDAILAMGKDETGGGFETELEEAYATVVQLGNTGFGARLGRMRLPFGRVNPIHPHFRLYQDNPLPVENLIGDDGAVSNGATLNYLVPSDRVYVHLQAGLFTLNESGTLGASDLIRTARLLIAPTLNRNNELEIGLSGLTGHAKNGVSIRLLGADFQYRRFFGAAQRLLLAGEWFQHRQEPGGSPVTRDGFYLLTSWKPNRYWEYGLRYDQSHRSFADNPDTSGTDRALSAILTYRLNDQSFVRLQWRNLKLFDESARNDLIVQLMFGFGPHSHPLESTQ